MRHPLQIIAVAGSLFIFPVQVEALTICSASWLSNDGVGYLAPCSINSASFGSGGDFYVGSQTTPYGEWNTAATNAVTLTSDSAIKIFMKGGTSGGITIGFSLPIENPYLFFNYLNSDIQIGFNGVNLIDAENVVISGVGASSVVEGANNLQASDSGFIAEFPSFGTPYAAVNFSFANFSTQDQYVQFTFGSPEPVPAPLPILGAGFALSRSKRFLRLSKQLRSNR